MAPKETLILFSYRESTIGKKDKSGTEQGARHCAASTATASQEVLLMRIVVDAIGAGLSADPLALFLTVCVFASKARRLKFDNKAILP